MKAFLIRKKYQWARLILVTLALLGVLWFSVQTAGISMPYFLINIGLVVLIDTGLLLDIKVNQMLSLILTVLVPVFSFYILEGYSQMAIVKMEAPIQILNIILYVLIFVLMAGISGNFARASVITSLIWMVIALANYYTVQFRQTPILPWDLLSVKTALSVTGNYTFKLPGKILMLSLFFVLLAVAGSKIHLEIQRGIVRLAVLMFSGIAVFGYSLSIQSEEAVDLFGLDTTLFTPNVLYRNNGFAAAFTINLQYLKIDKPDVYGSAEMTQLISDYTEKASEFYETAAGNAKDYPNVIVIMNETFSDLSVLADFETNQDYMPFIHRLQSGTVDNVVSGNLFVSVLGGNTANSEFEFLTGNSMAFLPPGSVAYQQYINDDMPSLARTLKSLGIYDTVGMHPYYMSGWDRDEVYPYFGFDACYFKEQMTDVVYLRKYISDQSLYDKIIEQFDTENDSQSSASSGTEIGGDLEYVRESDASNRKFIFAVTMQNHGGYFDAYDNFDQEIETLNIPEGYSKSYIDMYLSLIKKSDEAFENLVSYFKDYDEPTIILMFGDHQPGDYVIKSIYDTTAEMPLETAQQRYIVPFVIWANYEIEAAQVDAISVNYLSSLLFEKAGIPLTGYQQYLSDLRETLPVITANVMIDARGDYYAVGEEHPYETLLEQYRALQYNYLFDPDAREDAFFGSCQGSP